MIDLAQKPSVSPKKKLILSATIKLLTSSKNMKISKIIGLCILLLSLNSFAQKKSKSSFQVVPLGVYGGMDESNLSAYLVAPTHSTNFICLDAGTLHAGIEKAVEKKVFKVSAEVVLKKYIKGYLISHAHLDHVSGLIINSPADSTKTIYASPSCIKMMKDHYFNGQTWANFGDEGEGYLIKKYHFQQLSFQEETPITNTSMTVKAFPLSHVNPFESTAFLIKNEDAYVLYLGDTGSDRIEKTDKLSLLWHEIAPLVKSGELKGIFIEVSFPNEQADAQLFGHLTPKLLLEELHKLSELTGKEALKGFKIVVTHLKPVADNCTKIKVQLKKENDLGLALIFPEQARHFEL
jgi:3',5'-cyclic-nucleotide phosphodiesterase